MITDKDLRDRFSRLPKWAQEELESRDRMIKSLTDELMEARGEIANPFVWVYEPTTTRGGFSPRPLLGAERPKRSKSVLIGSDADNAFHIDVSGNSLRITGRNLRESMFVKPHISNVVEIVSAVW